jgi:AcrR family transcriptional regulator
VEIDDMAASKTQARLAPSAAGGSADEAAQANVAKPKRAKARQAANVAETNEADAFRKRLRIRILQIAEDIVREEGLVQLQARRIAESAGCSVGTIYNIFGDLDQLILAVNSRTLHDLGRALMVAGERTRDADLEHRLLTLAITYLDFASANFRRWRAVFEHRFPEAKELPADYINDRARLLALIDVHLKDRIADPALRADAARALFSAVHGNVLLTLDRKLAPFDPGACERQIRFLIKLAVASM